MVLDDLARCTELSAIYQAVRQEERQARATRMEAEEKAFCEERNGIAGKAVSDALQVIRDGGVLKNDKVTFYRSKYDASVYSIVLYLMRQYRVDVPLRTQGWINEKLIHATVRDGRCCHVQYLRGRNSRCSEMVFTCMDKLIRAVTEQACAGNTDGPGAIAA